MSTDASAVLASNAAYLAELFQLYQTDPALVDSAWAEFFEESGYGQTHGHTVRSEAAATAHVGEALAERLVEAYRRWGHLQATLSPLVAGGIQAVLNKEIDPSTYLSGKSEEELLLSGFSFAGAQPTTVRELLELVRAVYCGTIAFEFSHINSSEEREWLEARIEGRGAVQRAFSAEKQREFLQELLQADLLEAELHKKYVGAKRFSLEGNDTLMPLLAEVLDRAGQSGIREAVFGMAHRGRLNVLINTLKKPLELLFSEFEDKTLATVVGAGDVKYHLGFESDFVRDGATVRMSLVPNPSHLEFVNPVVAGVARAKQDVAYGRNRTSVLPIAMHGDAAVAGQGIVFETLNYAGTEGYTTGGTLHIVINNQIGFTTTPDESRSTRYCTDLAKGLDVPVFHVNAEDPEAACWAARLAVDYRNTFGKDVFIDLIGHRKHGHNEGDDPTFTQPLTYGEVKKKLPIWQQYGSVLKNRGVIDDAYLAEAERSYKELFAQAQERVRPGAEGDACPTHGKIVSPVVSTKVDAESLRSIADQLVAYPDGFVPHPKLAKILEKRVETVHQGEGIEWGVAEALAFGSLVKDGVPVRLSGQDCRRGTFSHRHLVLDHYEQNAIWSPLAALAERVGSGGRFEVYNSTLSEGSVLGFEFGYSATDRSGLVMWEAQFGDFANGAQVMIDQFVCSSESKWGQISGVTLLLPHGFEGQGPEHSSARLERYLQLCAEGNMSVCYPTNAAQQFHLLRRQGLSEIKRPLVVMTPKSLLRLPAAMSSLRDFTDVEFAPLLVDTATGKGKGACETIVLLTGKVYYDVKNALQDQKGSSVRVARVEELYPFPAAEVAHLLRDTKASRIVWVQEEPQNQGAWSYIAPLIREATGKEASYIGRPAASATATGSGKHHAIEQRAIMEELVAAVSSRKAA
jgi:2-oxoglutarate dehydrogenase E1 component